VVNGNFLDADVMGGHGFSRSLEIGMRLMVVVRGARRKRETRVVNHSRSYLAPQARQNPLHSRIIPAAKHISKELPSSSSRDAIYPRFKQDTFHAADFAHVNILFISLLFFNQGIRFVSTMLFKTLLPLLCVAISVLSTDGFATPSKAFGVSTSPSTSAQTSLKMSDDFFDGGDLTQVRIAAMVEEYPVVLFMKGNKLFPQCGFSNTATQILGSFGIEFHTVDVLADENIRQGIKIFSEWPTIPQLYVAGEFIGGTDIMIEMYQSGELGEMIEKAKADMV
jgi:monothiol glutaredoxin